MRLTTKQEEKAPAKAAPKKAAPAKAKAAPKKAATKKAAAKDEQLIHLFNYKPRMISFIRGFVFV